MCFSIAIVCMCGLGLAAQSTKDQWLIVEVRGAVSVSHRGEQPAPITKYDVLTRRSQLYCRQPEGTKTPCGLSYYSPKDGQTIDLPLVWKSGRSAIASGRPEPVKTADEFVELLALKAVPAGRRKNTPTCHGELPLTAPTCGETIDPTEFSVRWTPSIAEPKAMFTLLIGGTDSSERRRWNSLNSFTGEYASPTFAEYLRRLQLPDKPSDVTIRLVRTSTLEAVRLVRLPSRAESDELRRRLAERAQLPALPRHLAALEDYIAAGMWSRAADVSRQLLRDAPKSLEIQKYALVGLCRSGEATEIIRLRTALKSAGVTGLCEEEAEAP